MLRANLRRNPGLLDKLRCGLQTLAAGSDEISVASICPGFGVGDMIINSINEIFADDDNVPKVWSRGWGFSRRALYLSPTQFLRVDLLRYAGHLVMVCHAG